MQFAYYIIDMNDFFLRGDLEKKLT